SRCTGTAVGTCDHARTRNTAEECGSPSPPRRARACTALQIDTNNTGASANVSNAATNPSCSGRCTYALALTTGAGGVAVDSTNIYWTFARPNGAIVKEPLAGGAAVTL